jgi:cysteine-rich repeat protein
MVCIDAKGGLSQHCCEPAQWNHVPCHPTFAGGPGIVRDGKEPNAVAPSPWGDDRYPKTASATVLAATFCQAPTGSAVTDITMGLPGPGALIMPVDQTWATSACGNGIVEFDEQCDDGNGVDGDCCSALCRRVPAGTPCGDDGRPCTSDVCDAAGACTHPAGNLGTECRAPEDACDAGDVCDGEAADCPSGGRGQACLVTVPDAVNADEPIPVTCEAAQRDDVIVRRASRCVAVGFVADGVSGTPGVEPDALGPQVTKRAAKKLKRVPGELLRRRVLTLELNRAGKRLLRERGTLDVMLRVTVHHGRASHTQHRLVTVGNRT